MSEGHRPAIRLTTSGEPVRIDLPESPTTGYRWQLEEGGDAVEVLGASFTQDPGGSGPTAGGGGTRTFRIGLLDPDGAELTFRLRRTATEEPLGTQLVVISSIDR
ncbi:protease inhibitor I42 family protein [Kribbella speibonae]|uniref:Proteinase inhibitor I42 chagasin domain-containing protein n=1 Tax=Kribbella speibonae TaxID=1572660 RepID=A0ABY2A3V8_9ACTN|nr:protease inhibitor I42 family protein [Kribbella speibonae]TCC22916.1 hypothetical protein E0H58_21340 [Kribbella speibonae]